MVGITTGSRLGRRAGTAFSITTESPCPIAQNCRIIDEPVRCQTVRANRNGPTGDLLERPACDKNVTGIEAERTGPIDLRASLSGSGRVLPMARLA
jgi:hypothetical protein